MGNEVKKNSPKAALSEEERKAEELFGDDSEDEKEGFDAGQDVPEEHDDKEEEKDDNKDGDTAVTKNERSEMECDEVLDEEEEEQEATVSDSVDKTADEKQTKAAQEGDQVMTETSEPVAKEDADRSKSDQGEAPTESTGEEEKADNEAGEAATSQAKGNPIENDVGTFVEEAQAAGTSSEMVAKTTAQTSWEEEHTQETGEKQSTDTTPAPPTEGNEPVIVLNVHDECDVFWKGGDQVLRASVVARRPVRRRRRRQDGGGKASKRPRRKSKTNETEDDAKANELEYYVHYVEHDRRLDEWVTLDSFQLDTLVRGKGGDEGHAAGEGVAGTSAASTLTTEEEEAAEQATRALSRRRSSGTLNAAGATGGGGKLGGTASAKKNGKKTASASTTPTTETLLTGGNWHSSSSGGNRGGGGHGADGALTELEREHEETTKIKNIERILMGQYEVEAWYYSPYPEEYSDLETLYVCEYCLTYMKKSKTYRRHKAECKQRHPPGKLIYKEPTPPLRGDDQEFDERALPISVYEIDGKMEKSYCQKLCLLAKLFLDHKTLYYDVNPFYFYIITRVDHNGAHIVGYFSKEKISSEGYNLACILTLPQYQQCGYGKFIISLSYELTKREGKTGSPEKPLSDLGKLSYRSYWTHILMHLLYNFDIEANVGDDITLNSISLQTGIKTEDIISTLQYLEMIKVWKGQHVVYCRQEQIESYMKLDKKFRLCKPEYLDWDAPCSGGA